MVRYTYRKMPDVAKTPVPLSDLSISNVRHRTASYFGYEFELPWDDVDEEKDKNRRDNSRKLLSFGKCLLVLDLSSERVCKHPDEHG